MPLPCSSGNGTRIEALLEVHRAGDLDRARFGYEELLATAPGDANLLGLLGVIAVQQNRVPDAERLLRKALHAPAPPAEVHLRNLNSLFTLLHQEQREDEARALAGSDLPDWPKSAVPGARERATLVSLAKALALYGQPERAVRLLDSVIACIGDDPKLLDLLGRLHLRRNDPAAALVSLQQAAERDALNWQTWAALSFGNDLVGDRAAAREAAKSCARAARSYCAPRRNGQTATILVLNDAPTSIDSVDAPLPYLHFRKNYISQVSKRMAGEFRFASVFADFPGAPDELPRADIVFNNMASGERMSSPGRLEQVEALIDQIGKPVINHPVAVLQTTRQKTCDLLRGIPGLRVPLIERYWRDMARFDEIEASIAATFAYPVIVRHVAADQSSKSLLSERKTAMLIRGREELRDFLASVDWPQFYVIEYVDLRKPDGNFRKLRAAFFPDEIVFVTGAHYKEWMVGGWRAVAEGRNFYEEFPHLIGEMNRTLLEPEAILGSQIMPVLQAVRRRVPLEVFGMDFDVDDAGEIVLFEAGATMNFHPRENADASLRFPREPGERVDRAFRRLVKRRMTGSLSAV